MAKLATCKISISLLVCVAVQADLNLTWSLFSRVKCNVQHFMSVSFSKNKETQLCTGAYILRDIFSG